jgi:carboxyl-terminal processing protease
VETVLGCDRNGDDTWDWIIDDDRKIAYIRITGFSRHTADELRSVLEDLMQKEMKGLILDLRFNPGGLLSAAVEVSDMFVSEGRIVSTDGRNVKSRSWDARKKGTFEGFAMAILVNGFSASASEIVAACLQDHDRAVIIGSRTWGKGSVQNVIKLSDGASAVKLTTADYHRPNGENIHRFPDSDEKDEWGVKPDEGFAVRLTDVERSELIRHLRQRDIVRPHGQEESSGDGQNATQYTDTQLAKALEYLKQSLSTDDDEHQEATQAAE